MDYSVALFYVFVHCMPLWICRSASICSCNIFGQGISDQIYIS